MWFWVANLLTQRLLARSKISVSAASSSRLDASRISKSNANPRTSALTERAFENIPASEDVDEARIYTDIAVELESGNIDKGLWIRLFAESGGDENQTKVLYIKRRSAQLIKEQLNLLEMDLLKEIYRGNDHCSENLPEKMEGVITEPLQAEEKKPLLKKQPNPEESLAKQRKIAIALLVFIVSVVFVVFGAPPIVIFFGLLCCVLVMVLRTQPQSDL